MTMWNRGQQAQTAGTPAKPSGHVGGRRGFAALPFGSSMKTRRSGSSAGWRRMKARRAAATSRRCGSAACRLFFEGDVVSGEEARDGALANGDAVPLGQRAADRLQRQVRLVGHQRQHGCPRHRSLIAGRGSSPLVELFYACVLVGSCAYQVSVLSGVSMCRPMMVSEVPASECQVRGSCDPEITAATMPTRSPLPRPGKSCSPPKRGGTCRIRRRSRQPPCSTSGTRCRRATCGGE
jgi:hypothetical protein